MRFARDLVNEPASAIYPDSFIARTREAFAGAPGVTIEVLDQADFRRLGMGAIAGVGQGSPRGTRRDVCIRRSEHEPQLVGERQRNRAWQIAAACYGHETAIQ